MTKYVLNSGGLKYKTDLKQKFHNELIKYLGDEPKFLLCNFWQPREYWEQKFKGYCDNITEDIDSKPIFALAQPDKFEDQCEWADIIYCHGGDDHLGMYWMRQFDINKIFNGKIVATNSGSSDMLSAHFWPNDWRKPMDGLGILPIKFMPHYGANNAEDIRGPVDWSKAVEELSEFGDKSLPIYKLKEGEFVVIEDGKEVSINGD